MDPFRIPDPLRNLRDVYPSAESILYAARNGGDASCVVLARLWLSEGIPFAFAECPAVFEVLRGWLGARLGVHPKEISLTGSARIGSSVAPAKIGKTFSNTSDLDLFVVSLQLFDQMRGEFDKWAYEYESGKVRPSNSREHSFWSDNAARGGGLISRGLIDQKLIPNRADYPVINKISQGMWLLTEKLKLTPGAPKPKQASIRCYKSWDCAVRQISLNLKSIA